ncbi:MAG: restriction endonuclease [Marinospirillum sp.]|uniref:restriction endonuclease n=1 Tax=Marinospirillum sp. TaxID=2183934 RepID=UPI0019FB610A|nr:restriction endonuclease [Marinospirillum sp.]MBE0506988.1 restriction endonuclease [Marinospirillum sp.]
MMEFIYKADYGFFEKLVIKLLQKIGYGWDENESGVHTGGPKDEGVDGIIHLDQLGLDKVYIQAKRYKVGSPIGSGDIQRFIGSMNTKGASKGVFITSSTFSDQAVKEAGKAQLMKVELIDGEKLSDVLIKNNLGVSISKSYEVYTIDTDAFLDN